LPLIRVPVPFTSDRARRFAAMIIEAADELDRLTGEV
jgi:hypothetical protein